MTSASIGLFIAFSALLATPSLSEIFEGCKEQERFDIIMCESHMCTDCVLEWCMKSCQETQQDFPTCRCKDWPEKRTSYSSGDFKGKGKFGDVGDYAKGEKGEK